ncbi:hypothetical protein SCOCK_30139 [Actinacidiphila cocklensis]|uniref:Uncharacterized protein n=1 Tax=Actinacidiphila cocklensis TaxID=887465 RepID=A0A9W4DRZ1_9ACTN|nr:hypothetical protein SCOCK_30139 [Actinacidiphila cocklensis]
MLVASGLPRVGRHQGDHRGAGVLGRRREFRIHSSPLPRNNPIIMTVILYAVRAASAWSLW